MAKDAETCYDRWYFNSRLSFLRRGKCHRITHAFWIDLYSWIINFFHSFYFIYLIKMVTKWIFLELKFHMHFLIKKRYISDQFVSVLKSPWMMQKNPLRQNLAKANENFRYGYWSERTSISNCRFPQCKPTSSVISKFFFVYSIQI